MRISPWAAADLRAPIRHFIVADLVAYAHQSDQWTLSVSLDDSLGEQEKGTRHLEAVEYHHDHTKSQGKKKPSYTNGTVHVKEHVHALADVMRQHRYEHARTLLETACQEAAQWRDYVPVVTRFLCQPT